MRWPGKIPAGTTCDELAITMDLLPTVAGLIDVKLPTERKIDGKDIWPLISGAPNAKSPHEVFYCYFGRALHAIRDRRWKLHVPHPYRTLSGRPGGKDGRPVQYDQAETGIELYDLKNDVGETKNIAAEHPEIVECLMKHVETARETLGDRLTKRKGSEVRPAGKLAKS
jgi:arylsulfatase A-like enzyme